VTTHPTAGALPRRVLIANRGEIAVRIARTCRALGVATVAVCSDVDAASPHVTAADQTVRIGGASPVDSYLRSDLLLDAAARTGADAVHPGYGFLAENPRFAEEVHAAGLTWVGPPADVIATMGDKLAAKRAVAAAGVPLVPGAELPEGTDPVAAAEQVGFPLLVKAAAGGGGKGMRRVEAPSELTHAVDAARRVAASAFGDPTVFLEALVVRPRHVEVQILGDVHGTVLHAFERECSIQRRHQKVVEEAPSPGLDDEVRAALYTAAVDAARAIGYVNAGTVEFVADERVLAARRKGRATDPRDAFAFLEVNTRLQVEHPVTEETVVVRDAAGRPVPLDLVREQLRLAEGAPLGYAQDDLVRVGHAIEARLYAEDPAAGYLPQAGTLDAFLPAHRPGVRWDLGVADGDEISPHYDPLLAKVIGVAPTRAEAAIVLARALDDTVLLGTPTNRDLLVDVLRSDPFACGDTTTDFLHTWFPDGRVAPPSERAVTTALAAVTVAGVVRSRPAAGVRASVRPGFTNADTFRPHAVYDLPDLEAPMRVEWEVGRDGRVDVALVDGHLAGATLSVEVHEHRGDERDLRLDLEIDGRRQAARVTTEDSLHAVATADGRVVVHGRPRFPDVAAEVAAGATLAPMPGSVVTVAIEVGAEVVRGTLLCTVEAMKMEHRVTAPFAGRVTDVRVAPGDQVDADAVLVVVADPVDDG
jgi:propionyl-CoA carboxylase alpha chain